MKKMLTIIALTTVLALSGCSAFTDEDGISSTPETPTKAVAASGTSDLCTAAPTPTAIGRDVYPIDPKYSSLSFLGELFTAYTCGSNRVSKLFGVDGNTYTLGSYITLKDAPGQSLLDTFTSIGFECAAESRSDQNCKQWQLLGTVTVDKLMELEPYYKNFEADDCIHCG